MGILRRVHVTVAVLGLLASPLDAAVNTWCGKVYEAGVPIIIPGGNMVEPKQAPTPLFDLKVAPRHSIYVASEKDGQFIVDAELSYIHGFPYPAQPIPPPPGQKTDSFKFTVQVSDKTVASGTVDVGTKDSLISFDLSQLKPTLAPYVVNVTGTTNTTNQTYTATTELFYLPEKTTGSVVKVDNLYGSLLYRNPTTKGAFKPFIPYGFYGKYDGWLNETKNLEAYADQGFNSINPVTSFVDGNMSATIQTMDQRNVLFQYDMRNTYQNLSSVAEQVALVKDHPSLLTWYTADEPDGNGDPITATWAAYKLLAQLDKYHPVALVLNCNDYYYKEHTSGADIIMEDAYPVGTNMTFSKWNTTCNATLGDCGCDMCEGTLLDVPNRIDTYQRYNRWLGGYNTRKPIWEVPQNFDGEGYWLRLPTREEVWVMDVMAFNHGSKGRLAWLYPPEDYINKAAAELAKVVTQEPILSFFAGSSAKLLRLGKEGGVDASYWKLGSRTLIGVANPSNVSVATADALIFFPSSVKPSKIVSEVWGDLGWTLDASGMKMAASKGLPPLATSFVVLE